MSEEKKPDEKTGAAALDDAALEAVSGGEKQRPSQVWADAAWDWVKGQINADDKEQQP